MVLDMTFFLVSNHLAFKHCNYEIVHIGKQQNHNIHGIFWILISSTCFPMDHQRRERDTEDPWTTISCGESSLRRCFSTYHQNRQRTLSTTSTAWSMRFQFLPLWSMGSLMLGATALENVHSWHDSDKGLFFPLPTT